VVDDGRLVGRWGKEVMQLSGEERREGFLFLYSILLFSICSVKPKFTPTVMINVKIPLQLSCLHPHNLSECEDFVKEVMKQFVRNKVAFLISYAFLMLQLWL
jgi:hypothetical protein